MPAFTKMNDFGMTVGLGLEYKQGHFYFPISKSKNCITELLVQFIFVIQAYS